MYYMRIREAHIEPRRIERRRARDRSFDSWEEWIQVLQRAQVESRDVDVEVVKGGERRKEDVELAFSRQLTHRSRYVRVLENERRSLDLETVERPAWRPHVPGDLALPVVRKVLAVQSAQQVEIHRHRLEVDVLHGQHRPARFERHVPHQV